VSGRTLTVCSRPGCPRLAVRGGRCEAHAPKPWADSKARRRALGLPSGSAWQRITRAVRERARHRCEQCGRPVAPGEGAVDHRVPIARGGSTDTMIESFDQGRGAGGQGSPSSAKRRSPRAGGRRLPSSSSIVRGEAATNLELVCGECHAPKTKRESRRVGNPSPRARARAPVGAVGSSVAVSKVATL
jgi:5-methylcytosine-specific restriction endonuclease McrA